MSSIFGGGGGGGGGSPPTPPKLRQVDTSLTGPLYTQSAAIGDQFANLMRSSYGLQPAAPGAPASWEAKYLGPGALAMMKQSAIPFAGRQDPQTQAALTAGFGRQRGGYDLGSNPYMVARQLGQAPLSELQRNQQFAMGLLNQWKPPDLRLTGEDLLNVKLQQQIQNAQAQQQAFETALQGQSLSAQTQAAQQAAQTAAGAQLASAGIKAFTSPTLSPEGYYQPSPFAAFFGGGFPEAGVLPAGATQADVSSLGGAFGGGMKKGGVVRKPRTSLFGS